VRPNPDGSLLSHTLGVLFHSDGIRLRLTDAATGVPLLRRDEIEMARRQAEENAAAEARARRQAEENATAEARARRQAEENAAAAEKRAAALEEELARLRRRLGGD
jgi:hypothetical protein